MVLSIRSVSRRFGRTTALDDVTLHVRRGDCYGLLGHNGAGKSTLMRIVLGWIPPSSGRIVVDGFDARRHAREARARIGGLIEVPAAYAHLSGRRNLELLSRLSGRSPRAAREEADRLLESVGLTHAAKRAVGEWSLGMRQRLGIASALVGDPELILLDEPTSGLDPDGILELHEWLRRLRRDEGKTILLSSHRLAEVEGLCNRVGILRQGRVVLEGETRALAGAGEEYWVAFDEPGEALREAGRPTVGRTAEGTTSASEPEVSGARTSVSGALGSAVAVSDRASESVESTDTGSGTGATGATVATNATGAADGTSATGATNTGEAQPASEARQAKEAGHADEASQASQASQTELPEDAGQAQDANGGRVATSDPSHGADAERLLARLGVASEALDEGPVAGTHRLELGGRAPGDFARQLIEAGARLRLWMPRPPDLESVYARAAREAEGAGGAVGASAAGPTTAGGPPSAAATRTAAEPATLRTPRERRAPGRGVRRVLGHELRVMRTRKTLWACALAPAAVGALAVWRRSAGAASSEAAIGAEELFSDTRVTAFEAYGLGMQAGLPLLALVLLLLASQSLAAELARGTLRNLLGAPLARWELVCGKALALFAWTLGASLLLLAATTGAAAGWFDFRPVVEILPGGLEFPLVPLEELWPRFRAALWEPFPPLAAFLGLGLAISALTRSAAFAIGSALAALLALEFGRAFARAAAFESWLPTAHLPSPLGDSSMLAGYTQAVTGVSNALEHDSGRALGVSAIWFAAGLLLALWSTRRRYVS